MSSTASVAPGATPEPSAALAADAAEVLAELAGPEARLRPDQLAAIDALVARRERVLLVQATGWGKSAVYWIATRLLRRAGGGPTLVVSPLLALMRNQVAAAGRAGIRAATINSANLDEWREIEARIRADEVDVLLISPERLNNPRFRADVLPALAATVGLLVVDEAHCISDWGHDFRPDYRRIADVLAGLAPDVPVLAATATANARVEADVAGQIGTATRTFRGSLDRPSLHLAVARVPTAAEQLAWLHAFTRAHGGPGLVYCLTVADAERVAGHLVAQGVTAAAYTGSTPAPERERIEAALDAGELACVVATSALGMGYDNPNLAFVVHLGSPSSPIAYYQQVGRAGRGKVDARVVLVPTATEGDIWAYFDATAMPPEAVVTGVLRALAAHGPCSVVELESLVNLRRGRLEALLKVLDVEGAVDRKGTAWFRTKRSWTYDEARYTALAEARQAEQEAMRAYQRTGGCRLRFLREQLDDPGAEDCGRCDTCTGEPVVTEVEAGEVAAAAAAFRRAVVVLEPRKQWPRGLDERRGNIKADHRAEEGRALAYATDPGWAEDLAGRFARPDAAPDDELLRGVAACLKAWPWGRRPTWVTWVPSRTRPLLVQGLAARLAEVGKMELVDAVRRTRPDAPLQARMDNSATQAANVIDAFEYGRTDGTDLPVGPGLVVDDVIRSGWTMTAVAEGLRAAGSGLVLPFALWKRPDRLAYGAGVAIRCVAFDADDTLWDPEVAQVVAELRTRYVLGLVSDGNTDPERSGLAGTFDFRLTADEVGIRKPDPRLFRMAAAAAGCHPSELAYVGDLPDKDVAAPQAAGCRGIWLNRTGAPPPPGIVPDATIADLRALPHVLAGFDAAEAAETGRVGVGPHPEPWPADDHLDPALLRDGDRRNVVDRYRYWREDAIVADLRARRHPFHVAVENWRHDRNIGAVVRNANAFGAAAVHIVGRRRWNRRGAMATDRYLDVRHHDTLEALVAMAEREGLVVVGIDNVVGSVPLESADLPERSLLLFGQEGPGLSAAAIEASALVCSIAQFGSTRSINAGVASGIAMHTWVRRHVLTP